MHEDPRSSGSRRRPASRALCALAAWASLLFAAGCSSSGGGAVASAEPTASAPPPPSASARPASAVEVRPPLPPRLVTKLASDARGSSLWTVPDALLTASTDQVWRLTEEGTGEPLGKVDFTNGPFGEPVIQWVGGRHPDAIDVLFTMSHGRVSEPSYWPLTGKGKRHRFAEGGGHAIFVGVARIGESALASATSSIDGNHIVHVRGPWVGRVPTPWEGKCPPPTEHAHIGRVPFAVEPYAFGASNDGTLFMVGALCAKTPAVEVWDAAGGAPRITPLGHLLKKVDYSTQLIVGPGDRAWIFHRGRGPVVEMRGAVAAPLTGLSRPVQNAFLSTGGVLHVSDGHAIFRQEGERMVEVARVSWPAEVTGVGVDRGVFWVVIDSRIHRLEKTEAEPEGDGCPGAFVHLYDVSYETEPRFTFPTTRKALSTFARLEGVELVDFEVGAQRMLGLVAPSREIADALIAHVKANMKDEEPYLVCHRPKAPLRKIPIAAGK